MIHFNISKVASAVFLSIGILIASGCNNTPENKVPPKSDDPCERLDGLFGKISTLENSLNSANFDWAISSGQLDEVKEELEFNKEKGTNGCMFIDHKNYPSSSRFEFIEILTSRIIALNIEDGIQFLIEMADMYKDDKEIAQFLGEDLCQIALKNPQLYFDFYANHPDNQQELLNRTAWLPHQQQRLMDNFDLVEDAEEILEYVAANGYKKYH